MKRVVVISLGGSIIVPKDPKSPDKRFLDRFKKTLRKFYSEYKFIIVCGGGAVARRYIEQLEKEHKSKKEISLAGIMATRMNARFLMQFFGKEANDSLPLNMKEIKDNLKRNNIVICGALRYVPNSTSDETAAKLSSFLKTELINITNVSGLYTSDPNKDKKAKLIKSISWKDFQKKAEKIKYHAGQHFVLDQKASVIIKENKIKTFIIGAKIKNLKRILKGRNFKGTKIYG